MMKSKSESLKCFYTAYSALHCLKLNLLARCTGTPVRQSGDFYFQYSENVEGFQRNVIFVYKFTCSDSIK